MDKKMIDPNEEMEIDLQRVFSAVVQKSWLIMIVAVLCAVLVFLGTFFLITPKYKAAAKFYVNNSSISVGGTSVSISSGDLVTSRGLVDSYIVILKTRETLNDVIDYAGVNRTYNEVIGMISAEAVDETEIFMVTVTSPDPQESERIANAIAYILPNRIGNIIEGTSAKVVEAAIVPAAPSSPSYTKNTVIGFVLGFALALLIEALRVIFDITIRDEEDIAQSCSLPILASVPDMTAATKGGSYYYGYGNDREKTKSHRSVGKNGDKQITLIGRNIAFSALESYKLLRTKLQFSFSDENGCRVIGISSSLSGEGKSLTAINLAYSLSELDKKVVLVDCDMRRPTLAEKLKIQKKPGLSNFLTGQSGLNELMQYCGIAGDEKAFHVIAAGQNPPNPIELLSSKRMDAALQALRQHYDYVILDFPPLGEVSDVLAAVNKVDGILLVVRQNYCNRVALSDTVRQFGFVNMKLLGVVLNATSENEGQYKKKYYYKYGKSYNRSSTEKDNRSSGKSKVR